VERERLAPRACLPLLALAAGVAPRLVPPQVQAAAARAEPRLFRRDARGFGLGRVGAIAQELEEVGAATDATRARACNARLVRSVTCPTTLTEALNPKSGEQPLSDETPHIAVASCAEAPLRVADEDRERAPAELAARGAHATQCPVATAEGGRGGQSRPSGQTSESSGLTGKGPRGGGRGGWASKRVDCGGSGGRGGSLPALA
jgi:hypothetical protein